jgi:hypothetical protein
MLHTSVHDIICGVFCLLLGLQLSWVGCTITICRAILDLQSFPLITIYKIDLFPTPLLHTGRRAKLATIKRMHVMVEQQRFAFQTRDHGSKKDMWLRRRNWYEMIVRDIVRCCVMAVYIMRNWWLVRGKRNKVSTPYTCGVLLLNGRKKKKITIHNSYIKQWIYRSF